MRNKGFFWFFTILLLVVSIYQLTFSFVESNVKKEAELNAEESVEALKAESEKEGLDSVKLPNGTYVNFNTDKEAHGLAKSAFVNEFLKKKSDQKVYLGNTFREVQGKSVALGLDLVGGMSVTLELSMPDIVKNTAINPNDLHFKKPYDAAYEEYQKEGGDFVSIFVRKHREMFPKRKMIREFSTDEVVSKITNKATDEQVETYLKGLSKGALNGVETIMANRINQFGVAQPNITKDVTTNRIYIELPGVKDQATVKERLQSTANLEFYLCYKSTELGNFFNDLLVERKDEVSDEKIDDLFSDEEDSSAHTSNDENIDDLFSDKNDTSATASMEDSNNIKEVSDTGDLNLDDELANEEDVDDQDTSNVQLTSFGKIFKVNIDQEGRFQNSPRLGFAKAKDTSKINSILVEKAQESLMDNIRFVWGAEPEDLGVEDTLYYTLYALKIPDNLRARVGGSDIENARVSFDPNQGGSGVSVEMNNRGTEEWGQMTSENVGNFIAITMDSKVFSAPVINGPITGGNTLISGNFTVEEAQALTDLLNAGALPAPAVIVDEAVVGPTIGAENARSGLMSFGIALILVLIYMIFYYGRAGLIADLALVINLVFVLGFLAAFGAVLTLAGIAGIVLTIGMSVDANVLIYERAREEVRNGKGMKMVIKDGYKNALPSILDGNVTTLLVAVVLKIYGTGPIESFATTLIIGIFSSVFTAVVVTRLIFEYQIARKRSFTFSTPSTKNIFRNMNIPFIKNRKKLYILSGILVIVSIVGLFSRGLKPSVEFTGGRNYEVLFTKDISSQLNEIKSVLRDNLREDGAPASIEAKIRNSDFRLEISTDYLQSKANSETQAHNDLLKALASKEDEFGTATIENSRSISAAISEEIQTDSMISVVLAMVMVFVYILIRFGTWQFSMGAVISIAHDVTIVLGIFSLLHGVLPFNMEIDQSFIAAVLTIVGYSINDTVVVFDRIREFLARYRHKSANAIINDSINSTLGRTINTSSTTFLVLLTIFLFGGESIKGFIFALMIGVVFGTYSSICIASPIMADLSRKKNKFKELAAKENQNSEHIE